MKWITLALVTVFLFLQYKLWLHKDGLHTQYAEIKNKTQTIVIKNQQIRQQNSLLHAEVEDLKNGFETVAEIARYDLGYVQDDELFYKMPSK